MLIRAGPALKRVGACSRHPREDEDVGAIWTDFFFSFQNESILDFKDWESEDLQSRGIFMLVYERCDEKQNGTFANLE